MVSHLLYRDVVHWSSLRPEYVIQWLQELFVVELGLFLMRGVQFGGLGVLVSLGASDNTKEVSLQKPVGTHFSTGIS